jgi:hypothetical protein
MNILSRMATAIWSKYKAKIAMYNAWIDAWSEYEAEYAAALGSVRESFHAAQKTAWAKYVAAREAAKAKYDSLYHKQSG